MSARVKKDRRKRRAADRADGGKRADAAEALARRMSDALASAPPPGAHQIPESEPERLPAILAEAGEPGAAGAPGRAAVEVRGARKGRHTWRAAPRPRRGWQHHIAPGRVSAGRGPAAALHAHSVRISLIELACDARNRARSEAEESEYRGDDALAASLHAVADNTSDAVARAHDAAAAADTADSNASYLAHDVGDMYHAGEPAVRIAIAEARAAAAARSAAESDRAAERAAAEAVNAAAAAHAGASSAAARHTQWAAAAAAFSRRTGAAAAWLREIAVVRRANVAAANELHRRRQVAGEPGEAREESPIVRAAFAAADMAALNAGVAAAAAADSEYAEGPEPYERTRGRWLCVAAALPPDIRATIAAVEPLPRRPAALAGLLRGARMAAADMCGAALAAGACLPVRAGLSASQAAAAVRAACPAPAAATTSYLRASATDFGARCVEIGRMPLSGHPDSPPAAAHLAGGPLCDALVEDANAALRPAVDVVAIARPSSRAGAGGGGGGSAAGEDYEYAYDTWAAAAAAESIDLSKLGQYEEAVTGGRFAGEQLHGLELPGSLFNGRRTCGGPYVLGHIGDRASDHEGGTQAKRGSMTCSSRACRMCWQVWKRKEARRIADKMAAAIVRARLADGGAAGGPRTPIMHLIISFGPADQAEWASGPEGRARLRAAAIAELQRRGRFWGWCIIDHSYRFTDGLASAYLSPHLHVIAIGWLDYKLNAERFQRFKDVPYEMRAMRQRDGRTVERAYGRCRGVFVKHLSTLDTREDIYGVVDYLLSHCTASARRLGETSGGEHAVRWGGYISNGRTQVAAVSRYERGGILAGDLVPNSGARLPGVITGLTVWHAAAATTGASAAAEGSEDTLSRAEPRHVFTGSGHAACSRALRRAAAPLRRDHPAPAKNVGVVGEVDGGDVEMLAPPASAKGVVHPPDDYLVLKVRGHSRPAADVRIAGVERDVAEVRRMVAADRRLMGVEGGAAAKIYGAGECVLAAAAYAADANRYDGPGRERHAAEMRRRAGAELRDARGLLGAAAERMYADLDGQRLAGLADRVAAAGRTLSCAMTASREKSRWVVVRVHSEHNHLCDCGARLTHLVFDPGGTEKAMLPPPVAMILGIGADESDGRRRRRRRTGAAVGGEGEEEEPAPPAAWFRMDAVGGEGDRCWSWLTGTDWMRKHREPYLPAWDARTGEIICENGALTPVPELPLMASPTRAAVMWDVLYSLVRADMAAQRGATRAEGGVSHRLAREAIIERTRALHASPPGTGRERGRQQGRHQR